MDDEENAKKPEEEKVPNKQAQKQDEDMSKEEQIVKEIVQHANVRIGMLGNVDSGKSTITGLLASAPGSLDDGRGLMREKLFNFEQERVRGQTMSTGSEIMGFMANGE